MRSATEVISTTTGVDIATQVKKIAEIMFAMWLLNGGDDWKLDEASKLAADVDAIGKAGHHVHYATPESDVPGGGRATPESGVPGGATPESGGGGGAGGGGGGGGGGAGAGAGRGAEPTEHKDVITADEVASSSMLTGLLRKYENQHVAFGFGDFPDIQQRLLLKALASR